MDLLFVIVLILICGLYLCTRGESNGLSILLDAETGEYLTDVKNNYADEGFAIQVSYNGSITPGRWISVSPGFHAKFAVQPVVTMYTVQDTWLFTAPYEPHPKLPLLPFQYYSKETCYIDCVMKGIYTDGCGCNPGVPVNDYPICEVDQLFECMSDLDMEKVVTGTQERLVSISGPPVRTRKPSVSGLETLYNVVVDTLEETTGTLINKSADLIKSLQINVDTRLSVLPFPWKSEIGCLWPGKHLFVIGAPNLDAARFSVNFMVKEDIALHFNPRFFDDEDAKTTQNYVVCNSRVGGQWGEEERTESRFPFARGHRFHITFVCEPEQFKILVDGMEFMSFIHRETIHGVKSYRSIDSLHIDGDIALKECIS